jgi:uncharacterized membrane protein HdeD (DUF308 family)
VLLVSAGVASLVRPDASLVVVAWLFAIILVANGVLQFLAAFTEPAAGPGRRALLGLIAALSVLAGVLCLRSPTPTLGAIAVLVGSWWVVSGVLALVAAVHGGAAGGRARAAFLGVLSVAGGAGVLLQPRNSLRALAITVGVLLVVLGLVLVIDAVRTRSAAARHR